MSLSRTGISMKTIICDTNVILRYLLADNKEQFNKAKKLFDKVKDGEVKLIFQLYVFTEVIYILESIYKISRQNIANTLKELINYKGFVCEKNVIDYALKSYSETKLHIVDCLLLSQSRENKWELESFDKELIKTMLKVEQDINRTLSRHL
jgi:predicted nucleic-acid-binding protein